MLAVCQLGYIGLGTADLPATRSFFTDLLGLRASGETDSSTSLRMDSYAHRILLEPAEVDDISFLGWQLRSPTDLIAITERLTAMGMTVREGTPTERDNRQVLQLFHFEAPDGLRNELFYGPHVYSDRFLPTRPMSGFRAEELGVGHVVVRAPDRDAAEKFYIDGLGMKLSDYGSGPLAFLRCNPRHHSLALMPAEKPSPRRLVHIMLEMQEFDDVGKTLDLFLERGAHVTSTLGKHVNDHMTSFYAETPGGLEIECGHGGRLVDEETWAGKRYKSRSVWGHRRPPTQPERSIEQ